MNSLRALVAVTAVLGASSTWAQATYEPYTFTTYVGPAGGAGAYDGTGAAAGFLRPRGVVADAAGNVYVTDNNTIRKITPAGVVTTLAGLAGSPGLQDGTGSEARLHGGGLAIDSSGTLYVAEGTAIRKVTPEGTVTTLAGSDTSGTADGTGSAAQFFIAGALTVDAAGNVYVADTGNHTIRKITPGGVVTTLAGVPNGSGNFDGTGSNARFQSPRAIAYDGSGNLYVTSLHTIRKVTTAGVVTTFAGVKGFSGNGSTDGSALTARFHYPDGIAIEAGIIYVADTGNHTIRKIASGNVSTVAGVALSQGSSDGTGSAARFRGLQGICARSGSLYVTDTNNNTIRKVTTAGVVTTLAGSSSIGSVNGTRTVARLSRPGGVALGNDGTMYIADTDNHVIRKVVGGNVSTFAGLAGTSGSANGTGTAARFTSPYGVATDSLGNVYVADTFNHTIRKISSDGAVITLAGLAATSGGVDGTGSAARFYRPRALAVDGSGNVYVADTSNHTIRKVSPGGAVVTVAGAAESPGHANGPGSVARFDNPSGIAVDALGNVFIADTNNQAIRKMTPAYEVSTYAGFIYWLGGHRDGVGTNAWFYNPTGVAIDSGGYLYVSDWGNDTIRKIDPATAVTTLGGVAGETHGMDGTADAARFAYPYGIAADNDGNVYVADSENHKIRVGRPALSDAASIDDDTAATGVARQLGVSSKTATTFSWSIVRRPSRSNAQLSSTTIANPTFTPDVADLYVFRLIATAPGGTSDTLVSLVATEGVPVDITPPSSVVATATSSATVQVNWAAVADAASYQIWRSSNGSAFAMAGTSTTTSFNDTGRTADTTYVYFLRAVAGDGSISADSLRDPATTVVFADTPLTAGTRVRAQHLTQLRTATNAYRASASLGAVAVTDPTVTAATRVKAVHLTELRSALQAARAAYGLPALTFTDATLTGKTIKAVHFAELRAAVQ
ncbi:MAG TPA: hypothetical protein VGF28_12475 [Thermoanaerobaculia bacterium]|jgi:sugar lactone lactonase YvrE